MLVVMVFIYAVGLAGTALQAFKTVQRIRIADAVKLGDENYSHQSTPIISPGITKQDTATTLNCTTQ